MRFAARIFFVLLLAVVSFLFVKPSLSFAQTQTNSFVATDTNPDVPNNMHTYTQTVTLEALSSVFCLLSGHDYVNPSTPCLGFDPTTHKIGYVKSDGLLGVVTDMTIALYTPPLHTSQYFQYLSNNFGFAKKSYAATNSCTGGVGFCGISPLLSIWSTFRNIVYLFFVIIFILVGFGIMLRMKIDPRTVMSIENQIPKLIIALLLVTFSFAIAGLFIDGMWVGSFVVVKILSSADTQNPISANTVNNNFFDNPLGFSNNILPGGVIGVSLGAGGSLRDVIRGVLTPNNSAKLGLTPEADNQITCDGNSFDPLCGLHQFWDTLTGAVIGQVVAGLLGTLISWIIGILGVLIILIAILFSMIRLWFILLISYISILLDVLLAPFQIMFGVFPGSKTGFGSWARDILANLLAFPAAIAMFLLGRLLMDAFTSTTPVNGVSSGTSQLFVPPLIGNPVGTAGNGNPIGFLIGVGIILMTPQIVTLIKGALKVQDNKAIAGIGQAIGAGLGTTKRVVSGGLNTAFGPQVDQKTGMLTYSKGNIARIARGLGWIR